MAATINGDKKIRLKVNHVEKVTTIDTMLTILTMNFNQNHTIQFTVRFKILQQI